jgi:hypothetical protein
MDAKQFEDLLNSTKDGGASRGILLGDALTGQQKLKLEAAIDEFNEKNKQYMIYLVRIQELETKLAGQGLTDAEKEEYKKLVEVE